MLQSWDCKQICHQVLVWIFSLVKGFLNTVLGLKAQECIPQICEALAVAAEASGVSACFCKDVLFLNYWWCWRFFSSYETDGANVHYIDKCICIFFMRSMCLPDALRFPFDRVNSVTLSPGEEYSTKDTRKILMMEAVCCAVGRTAQTRNCFASSG